MVKTVYNTPSILSIRAYSNDTVIGIRYKKPIVPGQVSAGRGEIQQFSRKSSRRLRLVLRNSDVPLVNCITLTYPAEFETNGRVVKKQLNTFLQWLRDTVQAKYCWVLEFQKRGAPHFHIAVDSWIHYRLINREWARIVYGDQYREMVNGVWHYRYIRTEIKKIYKTIEAYLSSYIRKLEQKTVPDGYDQVGRFWGCSARLVTVYTKLRVKGCINDLRKVLRVVRKYQERKMREYGIRWRWRHDRGFTVQGVGSRSRMVEAIYNNIGGQICHMQSVS